MRVIQRPNLPSKKGKGKAKSSVNQMSDQKKQENVEVTKAGVMKDGVLADEDQIQKMKGIVQVG